MSEVPDNRRLLAEGQEIELADGSRHHLVIGARALALIEDEYGSIMAFYEALQQGEKGRMINHFAFVLAAALRLSKEEALDLIDLRRVEDYLDKLGKALAEALPEAKGAADSPGNGRAARRARGSRGAASSGSR